MKALVESLSLSSGAALAAVVSVSIVWLLCSVCPPSLYKVWVVIVPFALANFLYWSQAWFAPMGLNTNGQSCVLIPTTGRSYSLVRGF